MQCVTYAHITVLQAKEAGRFTVRLCTQKRRFRVCVCGTETRENTVLLVLPFGEAAFLQDITATS